MTAIVNQSAIEQTPFDSIRHFDSKGSEFWLARELMPLLGYTRWDRVPDVIERAELACSNGGNVVSEHFSEETRKTKGRPHQDFKLSRLACYLVAMNGDPRKSEIAMAQVYFAVKTREAEVIIPAQAKRMTEMEMRLRIAELENDTSKNNLYLEARREFIHDTLGAGVLALIQGRPDAVVTVKETVTETVVCRNGRNVSFEGKSSAELGKELGFKTGKDFERWLTSKGRQDLICEGMRAVQAPYIPTEHIAEVKRLWSQTRKDNGTQLLLGE